MGLINKKEFTKTALDKNVEAFVVHVLSLNLGSILIYPANKSQIVLLFVEKIGILTEYSDFFDVFSEEKSLILQELTKLNQHVINLEESKQLLYRPIYSLSLVELKRTWQTAIFSLQSLL